MDHFSYSTNLLDYIKTLLVNEMLSGCIFKGKTDHAFGTPGGKWTENGYLFEKIDQTYKFIIRSIPKTEGSYIVIESFNINGQLYNIKLTDHKKFIAANGSTKLLESYAMTVGMGKRKTHEVQNEFVKQGVETNVISEISDKSSNWQQVLLDLLHWAIVRENVKKSLKNSEPATKNDISIADAVLDSVHLSKKPLNQILYGPPGTGKTFNSINKAIEIINPNFDITQERSLIKKEYDRLVIENQIVFTTFHQSMSYEDFIEGIKPKTKNENVTYSVEDGVFKTLVKRALTAYIRKEADIDETNSFDALYNDFVKSIKSFEGKRQGTFKSKTGVDIMLVEANETSILVKYVWSNNKKDTEGQHTFSVTKEKLKKVLIEGLDPTKIKSLKAELHPLIGHIHCELFAIYKSFYDFVITTKGEIESIHFDYEELSFAEVKEQFDLLSKEEINAKKVDPFMIIIDEINRGNVSQIFGELITLIEEDKRLGNDESLEVVLPYSNDKFGVPPNVFIIGTMNTADRSVEALDTALRRRFSFTEIMPVLKVVEDKNFSDYPRKDIMEKINNRIEILLDRNYTLGHAYFIKNDFENSFENEIIPLLQEYFYNDFGKIGLVLGKGFMREKAITQSNNKSVFADFETKNDVDIVKNYELIPFNEVKFEDAIATLLV
jgi:5-methylcytosine-specific restriction endonuclease McrBC GTP-binding regulatory subunit McrB